MVRRTSKSVKKHSKRNSHKAHSKRRNSKNMARKSSKRSLKGGAKRTSKRKTSKRRRNLKGGNPEPSSKRQQGGPVDPLPEFVRVFKAGHLMIPHLNKTVKENGMVYPRPPGITDAAWNTKMDEIENAEYMTGANLTF